MMWPSVEDERAGALADRLKVPAPDGWKRHSIPLTITFFVLTCIGVVAFAAFFSIIHAPYGVLTLAATIAAAELLIRMYKFQRTGVESALWIAGPIAFIISLPSQGKPEALLVFAAAALIAGLRVRNPVFIAAGAVLVDVYVHVKTHSALATVAFALGVTAGAAVALAREWKRPTTEWMWIALVLVMPLASYLAVTTLGIAYVIAGIALLAGGIAIKHRALLIGGAVSLATGAFEMQKHLAIADEAKLIAGGVIVLAIAIVMTRILRNNTRGFVISKTEDKYEVAQILGAIRIPAQPSPAASDHLDAGGGGFGGGGATGSV